MRTALRRPITAPIKRAATWLAGLALVGCQLAPEKTLPTMAKPAAWREGAADKLWPAKDWWRAFGSAQLDTLIARAERDNDDLAAAMARTREADAQTRIAGAPLLPSLDFSPSAEAIRTLNPIGRERHYGAFIGVLSASYELDLWGGNRAALQAAKASAAAVRYDREVVNLTIVASVAAAYFQVLELQDEQSALEAELAVAEQVLADMRGKLKAGVATELAVVQQEAVVEGLRRQLPPLDEQRAHALDGLAILTGQSPEAMNLQRESLANLTAPNPDAGLPSALLLHRPDVEEAEQQLAAANADITVARAQFLPQFNLSGQGGVEAMALTSGVTGPQTLYSPTLSVLQPIFNGGRLRGGLDYSRARYAELLAGYVKATRQAYADVEDALASVRATTAQQADAQRALDKANQALRLSGLAYRGGVVDVLDVLAAQSAVYPQELALDRARAAHLKSLVALYKALGGGWEARP